MTARIFRRHLLVCSALICASVATSPAFAAPGNGSVAAGTATITRSGNQTAISQTSDKAIINWSGFNLNNGEQLSIVQPATSAMLLNRDISGRESVIDGAITANGRVWIINAQGVTFGSNARVNVGGLVASTLDVGDADFLDGDNRFNLTAPIGHTSKIRTLTGAQLASTGSIALVTRQIDIARGSTITAGGQAILGSGRDVSLQFMPARNDDLDLFRFVANGQSAISSTALGEPITINGNVTAKQIYAVAMDRVNVVGLIQFDGTLIANGAASDGQGGILLSNSGGGVSAPGTLGAGWFRSQIRGYTGGSGTPIVSGTLLADSLGVSGQIATIFAGNGSAVRHIKQVDVDSSFSLDNAYRGVVDVSAINTPDASFGMTAYNASVNFQGDVNSASVIVGAGNGITGRNFISTVTDRIGTTFLSTLRGNIDVGAIRRASTILGDNGFGGVSLTTLAGDIRVAEILSSEVRIESSGLLSITARPTVTAGLYSVRARTFLGESLSPVFSGTQNRLVVSSTGSESATIRNVTLAGSVQLSGSDFTIENSTFGNLTASESSVGRLTLRGANAFNAFGITTNRIDQQGGSLTANKIDLRSNGGTAVYDLLGANVLTGSDAELRLTNANGASQLRFNQVANNRFAFIGSVAANPLLTNGLLDIRTAGDLTVQSTGQYLGGATLVSGGSLALASQLRASNIELQAATLDNRFGPNALVTGTGGKWAVYLNAPTGNNFNGLDSGQTAIWGSTRVTLPSANLSGNRYVFALRPVLTVTPGNVTKVYGQTVNPGAVPVTITGIQPGVAGAFLGDSAATAYRGMPALQSGGFGERATVIPAPAPFYPIFVDPQSIIALNGYSLELRVGLLQITPKPLDLTVLARDKTYDGTTTASGSFGLSGVLFNDAVSANGTLTFADRNAGTKGVTASGVTLSGAAANNYAVGTIAGGTASILRKALTAAALVDTKTYDGTTDGTGRVNLSGVVAGDSVTVNGAVFRFLDRNAGDAKTVSVSGAQLAGNDAGNYTLGAVADTSGTILRRAVGVTMAADSRTYDGTTTATGRITGITNLIAGDAVTAAAQGFQFASRNAGTGVLVTANGVQLQGAGAGNYVLSGPVTAVADILARSITAMLRVNDKVYDGTLNASGSVTGLQGVIAGDQVAGSGGTFTFASKNVGSSKPVSASGIVLSGTDAGNYILTIPTGLLANVTPRALTASVRVDDKTYDGTTVARGTVSLGGVVAGDNVSTTDGSFAFASRDAGAGKPVSVAGVSLVGDDAGNYTLVLPEAVTANILRRAASILIAADGKTYDGLTSTTGRITGLGNVVAGDDLRASGGSYAFSDKNAGSDKQVTGSGFEISGRDAGNYTFTLTATALADILRRAITGTVSADDKTYDGTTAATGRIALSGILATDSVNAAASLAFADKNAGRNKVVSVSGATLTGGDAGNYTLTLPTSAVASILQKALVANVSVNDRTYDGTTQATGSIGLTGVVAGDAVQATGGSFQFSDKAAGTAKRVSVSGVSLNGADAPNYTLVLPETVTANILQRLLLAEVAINSRNYDGTTGATGTITLAGAIAGDQLGITGERFAFADKNAGLRKVVTVSGVTLTGSDSGNYRLSIPASVLGDILRRTVVGTVTVNGKTYDGTTSATGAIGLSNVVAGDDLSTSASFAFADKNAGNAKRVNITEVVLGGTDAGNYDITVPAFVLADIARRQLTATVRVDDKVYDATTAATGRLGLNGVITGDNVAAIGGQFTFDTKNAGANKPVSVAGFTLSGSDATNYTISFPASAFASITQRALNGSVAIADKTYDGTTAASGTVALSGILAGDQVSAAGGTFAFADKNAGAGKSVLISGVTLSGADAGNYSLSLPATVMASILRRAISATITAASKTYDGSTATTGSVALAGVLAGDQVGASGTSFAFANANAGAGKQVNVSGTVLTGLDAGNYSVTVPGTVLADIFRRAVTIAIGDARKREGDADPAFTFSVEGTLAAGDNVAGAAQRTPGEAAGQYAIGRGSLGISDNYVITFRDGILTIEPAPKALVQAAPDQATLLEQSQILQDIAVAGASDPACAELDDSCRVVRYDAGEKR